MTELKKDVVQRIIIKAEETSKTWEAKFPKKAPRLSDGTITPPAHPATRLRIVFKYFPKKSGTTFVSWL